MAVMVVRTYYGSNSSYIALAKSENLSDIYDIFDARDEFDYIDVPKGCKELKEGKVYTIYDIEPIEDDDVRDADWIDVNKYDCEEIGEIYITTHELWVDEDGNIK